MDIEKQIEAAKARRAEADAEIARLEGMKGVGKCYRDSVNGDKVYIATENGFIGVDDYGLFNLYNDSGDWDGCTEIPRAEFLAVAEPAARKLWEDVTGETFPSVVADPVKDAAVKLAEAYCRPIGQGHTYDLDMAHAAYIVARDGAKKPDDPIPLSYGWSVPAGFRYTGEYRPPSNGEWYINTSSGNSPVLNSGPDMTGHRYILEPEKD